MADKGENIVIRRGDKAYTITPIKDEDLYFTPEMLARIDESVRQAKEGKTHSFSSMDELDKYIDSL